MIRAALILLAFVLLSACSAEQDMFDMHQEPACKEQENQETDGGVGGTGHTPCNPSNDNS